MTVAELIDVLSKMPQDAEVWVKAEDYGGNAYWDVATTVRHDDWEGKVEIT